MLVKDAMTGAVVSAGPEDTVEELARTMLRHGISAMMPLGLAGSWRSHEPTAIARTVAYGNYVTMGSAGRYRIAVLVTRPGATRPIDLEFSYDHRTR